MAQTVVRIEDNYGVLEGNDDIVYDSTNSDFNGLKPPTIKQVLQSLGLYEQAKNDKFLSLKAQIYLSLEGDSGP